MLWMTVALFISLSSSNALPEGHKVPQLDGSFKFLSPKELAQEEELSLLDYKPHIDIDFHLYTRKNPEVSQVIPYNDSHALRNSNFNARHNTILIVHGWGADIKDGMIQGPRREYLKKGDYNIIGVDWSKGGSTANYAAARYRVASTGYALADYIVFLWHHTALDPETVLPVGFSLGAHVVGYVGRGYKKFFRVPMPAIIALDPAGPLFDSHNPDTRINDEDAVYVEVIHTNGGTLGMHARIGDGDFYVNGGKIQKGCGVDLGGGCSHTRAPALFIESINGEKQFVATRCSSYESVSKNECDFQEERKKMFSKEFSKGVYYVKTDGKSPFALG